MIVECRPNECSPCTWFHRFWHEMWKIKACAFRFRSCSLKRHPTLNSRPKRELLWLEEKANENSYKYVWVGCGGFFGASLKRVRDPSEWISNRELYVRTYSNTLFCLSCRYCVHMTPPVFCVFSLTPRILLFSFAIFSLLGCLIPIASERCVCVYGDGSSYLARCEQTWIARQPLEVLFFLSSIIS